MSAFHVFLRARLAAARGKQGKPVPQASPMPTPTDHRYAADVDSDGDVDAVQSFDVAEHTVAQVLDYVEANPDGCEAVREAEERGKQRSGILDHLPC